LKIADQHVVTRRYSIRNQQHLRFPPGFFMLLSSWLTYFHSSPSVSTSAASGLSISPPEFYERALWFNRNASSCQAVLSMDSSHRYLMVVGSEAGVNQWMKQVRGPLFWLTQELLSFSICRRGERPEEIDGAYKRGSDSATGLATQRQTSRQEC
jgi:hypothetical protein